MSKKTFHVTPDIQGRWVVRRSGSDRAEKTFDKQREAIDFAKEEARRVSRKEVVEVFIHQKDGRISQKDTYASDPAPPSKRKR